MELLNNTPSTPDNIVNHQFTNNGDSSLLEANVVMEPNNLSQSAARILTTSTAPSGATAPMEQAFTERNLELKLPILSSSSSDSESEDPTNLTAGTSTGADGERTVSPPPNCAICLGRCKNKCFTDSCMHQFCFKCLCEWSKVKPECPLCKQTFKSIIHNVKSIHQFEEYHVQPPAVQISHPPFEMDFQEMRIFGVVHPGHNRNHVWNEATHRPFFYGNFSASSPYSTASTGGSASTASGSSSTRSIPSSANGSGLRNQYVYRGELLDLYRQEYPGAIANSGTLSQLWRRYVYDRKLYALPVADVTGRFRESSARFYRDNPSQIHRLMPWINRDIVCLLRQNQQDVTTVLESINSALTLMNILSPAFRRRLQPFLGTKTAHFIHELSNFARSPYDMIGYDRAVQYSPQTNNEEIVIEFTSSDESTDNEQIELAGDSGTTIRVSSSRSRSTNVSSINAINLTIHNRLTSSSNTGASRTGGIIASISVGGVNEIPDDSLVIDLRGESDNNDTAHAQATTNSTNYQNEQNGGASEGDMVPSGTQATVSENIELTSGSSDECEFVLERKPPHLRTPEMVSLDSASDSDVVFVDESKPLNRTSFSSSEEEPNEGRGDHKHHSRQHNKIAALVEAKKRSQPTNLIKSEQQDCHTEEYNLGASTSAALRLSLQKRVNKSYCLDGEVGGKRLRRKKYSLRNSDSQAQTGYHARKGTGKHLYNESSHSSTSSSASISSSSSDITSTNSSTSFSDEDYVATTSQREPSRRKCGSKTVKTKKRKASRSSNRRTAIRDSRNRKKNYYSSDDDDDEDEDSHMGKNFALVMAMNERRKRQNQKGWSKNQGEASEQSEGENSWRLEAVNKPLRRQQQQRAKCSNEINKRKRQHTTSSQQHQTLETRNNQKRLRNENQTLQEDTSSDESDNINLVQLKTKLAVQTTTETAANNDNSNDKIINGSAKSATVSTNVTTTPTKSITTKEHTTIPTAITPDITTDYSSPNRRTDITELATRNVAESITNQNDLYPFSENSNENIQNESERDNTINNNHENIPNYLTDNQTSLNNYHDSSHGNPTQYNSENINQDNNMEAANGDLCDSEETCNNVPQNMQLNESNVFADGTNMSTATTDTILHEAAEQISPAAVNFHNSQQSFYAPEFADENSTNSSSSNSSSSTSSTSTTSLSSASISSSSSANTSNYIIYEHS